MAPILLAPVMSNWLKWDQSQVFIKIKLCSELVMCKSKFVYRPAVYDNRILNVSLMSYCWGVYIYIYSYHCIASWKAKLSNFVWTPNILTCMNNVWLLCAPSALCVLKLYHLFFKALRYSGLFYLFSPLQYKVCSVNDCRSQHCWLGKIRVVASMISDGIKCAAQIGAIFTTLSLEHQGQHTTFKEDLIFTVLSLPLEDNVGTICYKFSECCHWI